MRRAFFPAVLRSLLRNATRSSRTIASAPTTTTAATTDATSSAGSSRLPRYSPDGRTLAFDHGSSPGISLLDLRPDIGLPNPRSTVPAMVEVGGRHPRLNLLNLEAVAVARLLSGTVWLSERAAEGILPPVLDAEGIAWRTVPIG